MAHRDRSGPHSLGRRHRPAPRLAGIEARGGQTITHLETPPVGPRITVRATPGTRRHGVQMQ